jgi:DNA-binding NarL/FixJ family response regulator
MQQGTALKVVVLTMYTEYASAALTAGADAFVCIGEPPGKLLTTLAAVAKGQPSKAS